MLHYAAASARRSLWFAKRCAVPALAGGAASVSVVSAASGEQLTCRTPQVAHRGLSSLRMVRNLSKTDPTTTTTKRLFSSNSTPVKATRLSAGNSKSFIEWYEGHLQRRPVWTKMCTGTLLWGIGDAVAQLMPQLVFEENKEKPITYDWPRTGRAAFFGFAIHAPLSHVHFNFLEWMTVRSNIQGLYIPVFKAVMEQFVYWSWISNSLYHGAMGAMQGWSSKKIYNYIADVLWDTQKAQWAFWIPVQLLNFRYVPVRHQLNVVLLTSVAWTALLSAWYPPQQEGVGNVPRGDPKPEDQKE